MSSLADALEKRLREIGTPERAAGEKAYLKSDFDFLGATVWQIRAAVKELATKMDHDTLVATVGDLWSSRIFERRMAAVFLLERNAETLDAGDLPLIEPLVRESRTWALVDGLAADVLGRMLERDPAGVTVGMDRWATDDDFWVRRASLLAELRRFGRARRWPGSWPAPTRCSRNASSSSAKPSAGSSAKPASGGRTRSRRGLHHGRIGPAG